MTGDLLENYGKSGFTKGSQNQLPLPILSDPELISKSKVFKAGGKALLVTALAMDIADAVKTGIDNKSIGR